MDAYRRLRRPLGFALTLVLLCAQWLVSAYACPVVAAGDAVPVAVHAATQPMPDCHVDAGSPPDDTAAPALCKAHCDAGQRAPAQAVAHDAPAPTPGWFLVVVHDDSAHDVAVLPGAADLAIAGSPPGWPPLHLTLQVLRN